MSHNCATENCVLPKGHRSRNKTPCMNQSGVVLLLVDGRDPKVLIAEAIDRAGWTLPKIRDWKELADQVTARISKAWDTPPSVDLSPLELIDHLIKERDELKAKVDGGSKQN